MKVITTSELLEFTRAAWLAGTKADHIEVMLMKQNVDITSQQRDEALREIALMDIRFLGVCRREGIDP